MELYIEEYNLTLHPGDFLRLHRFDTVTWILNYGWYSFGGNRPVCGWYLQAEESPITIKPLQYPDLSDIYIIEH